MTYDHIETELERKLRICEYLRNEIAENYQEQLKRANKLEVRVRKLKKAQRASFLPFMGYIG